MFLPRRTHPNPREGFALPTPSYPNQGGPLGGVRVLDVTQALYGPFCTMLMGQLGAEVIKVERPDSGDMTRSIGPFVGAVSTYFASINRGKRSITLNLSTERGRDIFLALAEHCDVVAENFVPGTMKRFGLDYETVMARNPKIVYASGSGFGQSGPYATRPAFDHVVQAIGGVMSVTGEPGGPPIRPGVSYGDIAAALFLCIATISALHERHQSGRGQMIDIAMLDCQVTVQENAFVRYFSTGEIPRALGTRHPVVAPLQVFPTKNSHIAIAALGSQWPLLCSAIDRIDVADDPRFQTGWLRSQNHAILEPILTEALASKTTQQWIEQLQKLGVPCGPVNTIDRVAADPHLAARNMFGELHHPRAGVIRVAKTPFKFSRTPTVENPTVPDLGEHTEEVLGQLLGMNKEHVDRLRELHVL